MTEICDSCRAQALELAYEPAGTTRGLKVYICGHCGLVQSLPRADRAPRSGAAVSAGADWGNVRYGKGFRTETCLSLLRLHADLRAPLRVLDAGSNRGSFAHAFLKQAAHATMTCIEPDERVADSCRYLDRAEVICARIEDVSLPDDAFEVVHSCHTIEHLASPSAVLADHWRVLKPGGVLILDAPNIALIGEDDIVEEWFIDKHLYHFSAQSLCAALKSQGFAIAAKPNPNDRENLLFAAKKQDSERRAVRKALAEADRARALVAAYGATRARNLLALTQAASIIAGFASKRVAMWGAGRLFDALVQHGGFDPAMLAALIDTHLKAHVSDRYGVPLSGPEALEKVDPEVIVVMSRAFAPEISRIAKQRVPSAEIILYADLLSRAKQQIAA